MVSFTDENIASLHQRLDRLREEIAKVIVGRKQLIDETLIALLCGGHVLLEGAPGLGKTLLIRTLSQGLELVFSRIQFTPDLMPADILGTNVLLTDTHNPGERRIAFQPGPIFANLVLADEINRATPKTQSALLEAMQEYSVTVAGQTRELERPFFVMATQNPIEMEGTYPLPEAQIDRFFFKLTLDDPNRDELRSIVDRTTGKPMHQVAPVLTKDQLRQLQFIVREVPIASHVVDFAVELVHRTHPRENQNADEGLDQVARYVRYGVSPRGAQTLVLAAKARALLSGRANASIDDIAALAAPALRHRLILSFEAEAEGIEADSVVEAILERTLEEVA